MEAAILALAPCCQLTSPAESDLAFNHTDMQRSLLVQKPVPGISPGRGEK